MRTRSTKMFPKRSPNTWRPDGVLLDVPDAGTRPAVDLLFPGREGNPLEIEIGSGKGAFLLSRGAARPDVNLLGIEYAKSYAAYSADRIARAGLEGVKVVCLDAAPFITTHVPAGSVSRLHIYFPDPWPKKKHHKRRLINQSFVADARRVLKNGGLLLVATDHAEYFRHIRRTLTDVPGLARVPFPADPTGDEYLVGTNFEKKYRREGRCIFRLARMKYAAV